MLKVVANVKKQNKEIKDTQIGKEEETPYLFKDYMTVYKNIQKAIRSREVSQAERHKHNVQN